jgi:hypothetical protein
VRSCAQAIHGCFGSVLPTTIALRLPTCSSLHAELCDGSPRAHSIVDLGGGALYADEQVVLVGGNEDLVLV